MLSEAGPAKLVFTVRTMLETERDFICVRMDIRNAYNEMSRAATIQALQMEPSLQHLAHFAAITLAPVGGLESGGKLWGEAAEGETQGDPASTALFCVGLQPSAVKLDTECKEGGGLARFGADDGFAIGPAEIVIPAVRRFALEVKERCLLDLQWSKSEIFKWEGGLPTGDLPAGLSLAGETVGNQFVRGFPCYGVPVGEDDYVTLKLEEKRQDIMTDTRKAMEVLGGERQSLWTALKWSVSQRFDYWCQLCRPSLVRPVADTLDRDLWTVLEAALGLSIPRIGGENGDTLAVPVVGRENLTFQEWVVRHPIKMGGLGFRSVAETSGAAFLGALEQAAPYMASVETLQGVVGGLECWGEEALPEGRWRVLLESGNIDGQELNRVWAALKTEASQAAHWLDRELEGTLAQEVESVGNGSTSGATRGTIMEERDMTRGLLLEKALELFPDREARPVWSWPQRDKLSSQ